MGDKYIIELEDKPFHKEDGDFLYRAKGFNSLVFDMTGIGKLTPYTEPDLEQVRKEAYDKGYMAAYVKSHMETRGSYQQGLADAWEAARKIIHMPEGDLLNIFAECYSSVCTALQVLLKYDAAEAIAKIKEYEDGKQEIKVGDIVRLKSAPEIEIWVTDISDEDGGRLSGLALKSVGDNCEIGDTYAYREIYMFERTGKHYDVAAVLAKMKEGES